MSAAANGYRFIKLSTSCSQLTGLLDIYSLIAFRGQTPLFQCYNSDAERSA